LPIPAYSEVVIEGEVVPGTEVPEGPFGEFTGYYAGGLRAEPMLKVKCLMHRNDPIITGAPPFRPAPGAENNLIRAAYIWDYLDKAGVPDVKGVAYYQTRLLVVVAIKQRYPGHAKQAGHVAAMCHSGAYAGRYVIVVDDDIDVSNLEELIWAMLTRSDPATSIDIIHNAWSTPLDPRIEPERKARGDHTNSRAIIDACRPWHWREQFPKVNLPSIEERRAIRQRFGYLLDRSTA
jgi:4-hydroxy-3-polyprenylbenzoate decarboxylase